jgi:zinc transporter ZupT
MFMEVKMPSGSVLFAFGLTLFAGLATGVGSALAFFAKKPDIQSPEWFHQIKSHPSSPTYGRNYCIV